MPNYHLLLLAEHPLHLLGALAPGLRDDQEAVDEGDGGPGAVEVVQAGGGQGLLKVGLEI